MHYKCITPPHLTPWKINLVASNRNIKRNLIRLVSTRSVLNLTSGISQKDEKHHSKETEGSKSPIGYFFGFISEYSKFMTIFDSIKANKLKVITLNSDM